MEKHFGENNPSKNKPLLRRTNKILCHDQCSCTCSSPCFLKVGMKKQKVRTCNQCGYATARAYHLKVHMMIHSGERPNKCNQCEYASIEAKDLRRHMKTHNGEKLNKCNQCEYAAAREDQRESVLYSKYHKEHNVLTEYTSNGLISAQQSQP